MTSAESPSHDHLCRPRLRPGLAAAPDATPGGFVLYDQFRLSRRRVRLSAPELECAELFTGISMEEVRVRAARLPLGRLLGPDRLADLARRLDDALFLHGPRLDARLSDPVREPSCIGCYEADPVALRRQLSALFTAPGGPGLPGDRRPGPPARAVLVPHMDYARGNVTYGHAFKELAERTDCSLFVVVGTSHYSPARFTLSRQAFRTPLGDVPTDAAFVDRLERHYGPGLFDDPFAHVPEHSIELEVVLLQFLLAGRRNLRIVPLLAGSFHDHVLAGQPPGPDSAARRMAEALRAAEREAGEPVCYVISGDLAHVGPKFNDPEPVTPAQLDHGRARDRALLAAAAQADADGFFREVAGEGDARRICGLPPAWVALTAAAPSSGRVLHYQQYVHPQGQESVSFAAAVFEP